MHKSCWNCRLEDQQPQAYELMNPKGIRNQKIIHIFLIINILEAKYSPSWSPFLPASFFSTYTLQYMINKNVVTSIWSTQLYILKTYDIHQSRRKFRFTKEKLNNKVTVCTSLHFTYTHRDSEVPPGNVVCRYIPFLPHLQSFIARVRRLNTYTPEKSELGSFYHSAFHVYILLNQSHNGVAFNFLTFFHVAKHGD